MKTTNDELPEKFADVHFDMRINCAASVKHCECEFDEMRVVVSKGEGRAGMKAARPSHGFAFAGIRLP